MKTLYEFHRNVLLGTAGSNIVRIAGCCARVSDHRFVVALPRKLPASSGWSRSTRRANNTRVMSTCIVRPAASSFVRFCSRPLTGATLVYLNYVRDFRQRPLAWRLSVISVACGRNAEPKTLSASSPPCAARSRGGLTRRSTVRRARPAVILSICASREDEYGPRHDRLVHPLTAEIWSSAATHAPMAAKR